MNAKNFLLAGLSLVALAGCDSESSTDGQNATAKPAEAAAPITNRIDIPEQVRQNLGITFAKVESRRVAATLRVPGRFELLPSARQEYRTVLPTRVQLAVRQYERVEPGQVLARLDSPEWRRIQHEAVEAEGEIGVAEANIDVADATVAENERAIALLRQRVASLAEANVSRAELSTELALTEGKAPRLAAEARAAQVKLTEAREHHASKLRTLAAVVNLPPERLTEPTTRPATNANPPAVPSSEPLWKTINTIEIRADRAGVVETLAVTEGGWVDTSGLILAVIDPGQIRFRATALQSDLARLRDGAAAVIVPPRSTRSDADGGVPGKVSVGLEASADMRTVELIVTPDTIAPWARPGVSAYAEVVTDSSAESETAIPVAAVVQDELNRIFFRRDPKDPDKAIRIEGEFGVSDGNWIVVKSGVKAGDEVVMNGVFELKLASGKAGGPKGGGHFHADGTWHADGTPEPGGKH
jgi:hypothetical protein